LNRKDVDNTRIKTVGSWPTWPESLAAARMRYAGTFLQYVHRSMAARRNFIIVAHGDCVAAALSVMPGTSDVDCIGNGGMFFASRQCPVQKPISNNADLEQELDLREDENTSAVPDAPLASDLWQLQAHGIQFGKKKKHSRENLSVQEMVNQISTSPFGKPFDKAALARLGLLTSTSIGSGDEPEQSASGSDSALLLFGQSASCDSDSLGSPEGQSGKKKQKFKGAGQHSTRRALNRIDRWQDSVQIYLAEAATISVKESKKTRSLGEVNLELSSARSSLLQRRQSSSSETSKPKKTQLSL